MGRSSVPLRQRLRQNEKLTSGVVLRGGGLRQVSDNAEINDPEAVSLDGRRIRMVRRAETNMGDLCVDAYRVRMGADVAVLGGGGVRDDIPAGEVKKSDALRVMPFGMEACKIVVTGQQILDALEWGAHAVPGRRIDLDNERGRCPCCLVGKGQRLLVFPA